MDPRVRAEAAVAAAYLRVEGASLDLALAASMADEILTVDRRPALVGVLAATAMNKTLRAAIWYAWNALEKGDGLVLRDGLGLGRVLEREREMRAKVQK
jgi:hypothetical protein